MTSSVTELSEDDEDTPIEEAVNEDEPSVEAPSEDEDSAKMRRPMPTDAEPSADGPREDIRKGSEPSQGATGDDSQGR